jgi:hypothetical protein
MLPDTITARTISIWRNVSIGGQRQEPRNHAPRPRSDGWRFPNPCPN